jgi:hypothetical protein
MLSCNALKPNRNRKHTAQLECLNSNLQRVNVQSIKEPMKRYCTSEHTQVQRRLRPDLEIHLGSHTYHLHISNSDAHGTSYRSYALAKRGGAIIQRENGKIYKYKGATDLLRSTTFVPFIFDRYGVMGEHSTKFMSLFARYCRDNCLIDIPKELMSSIYDSFSCSIIKENAKMILDHLSIMGDNITHGKFSTDEPTLSRKPVSKAKTPKKVTAIKRTTSAMVTPLSRRVNTNDNSTASSRPNVAARSLSAVIR